MSTTVSIHVGICQATTSLGVIPTLRHSSAALTASSWNPAKVTSRPRWSLSTTLPDGAYVAQARQSNGSSEGHSDEVTFFVDTQSPDLTIDRPASGGKVDDDGDKDDWQ